MKTIHFCLRKTSGRFIAVAAILALLASVVPLPGAGTALFAQAQNEQGTSTESHAPHKITICHYDHSDSYTQNDVSINALAGHDDHTNDIIPPTDDDGDPVNFSQNWNASTTEIWNNHCQFPGGTLIITKTVLGTTTVTSKDFLPKVNGVVVPFGFPVPLLPNTYTITEISNPGVSTDYTATFGGDCTASGTVTIAQGDHATCTITNEYTPPAPPTVSTSTVTMCKQDDQQNALAGWQLALLGEHVATTNVLPNGSPFTVAAVPPGHYVVQASGVYIYRAGGYQADAAFSERQPGDPGYGTYPYNPWRISNPANQYLGLQVNGDNHVWGTVFASSTHTYYTPLVQTSTSSVEYKITDDVYGDNSGSLTADLYQGYTGTTTPRGCIIFNDVPYGNYTVAELLQPGWSNVSGLGNVVINQPTQTIMVVNHNTVTPPPVVQQCSVDIVSDASTTVEETGNQPAVAVMPVNPGWTASIPGATWIWGTNPAATSSTAIAQTQTFDRFFNWNGTIATATLMVASDNSHSETINGVATSSDSGEFNYTAAGQDQYDVTSAVHTGSNHLQFSVTNFARNLTWAENPGGLLYKLHLEGTTTDPQGCLDVATSSDPVLGCTDSEATNYNETATVDDGSCTYDGGTSTTTATTTDLYRIQGFVFNDFNFDGIWDHHPTNPRIQTEHALPGWVIRISNGTSTFSTTTDAGGHYVFNVPAGTWTITEILQTGWLQTNGPHFTVTVPQVAAAPSFFSRLLAYLVPKAYAADTIIDVGTDYNFGNQPPTPHSTGGGGYVGSSNQGPTPQVLGASTTAPVAAGVIPVGAPNAGAGGSAPLGMSVRPVDRVLRRFSTHA